MTTVNVTAEHIANGARGSSWGCAIVLAIKDAFPAAEDASVGEVQATLLYEDGLVPRPWVCLDLPDEACAFIATFDQGDPVEPFTFNVDYPEVAA